MAPTPWQLAQVLKAAARLGYGADAQRQYVQSLGLAPSIDELALELNDFIGLVPAFVEQGWISSREAELLLLIDRKLESMSGPEREELWNLDALVSAPEWKEVRILAQSLFLDDAGSTGSAQRKEVRT